MLHMTVVRSPVAHARITASDLEAAKAAPGVVAVYCGQDLKDEQGSLPCAWPVTTDMVNPGHPAIAVDQVNHVGEAVAVIVARSRAAAADAMELVDIDYEPLPVVLDMDEAVKDGARRVHPDIDSNISFHFVFDGGEAGAAGNTDEAFANAEVVVSRRFVQQRLIPAFMEPRSVVVQPQGDNYTMWSATQIPHILRLMLALTTGIPEHKLRVVAPDVGGGFGGKLQVTPEELLSLLVARRLGKPIKWTETRSESLMSAHHGRDQIQYIDIASDREGNVKGLRCRILSDMGAYLRLVTPGVPVLGAFMFNGIYKFPAYRFECDGVFTNKTPTDAYRGAGRPEATFAVERIMDELAVELGMDPLELRRKNWIKAEEFPFTTCAGMTYDSGNYEAATQRGAGADRLRRAARGAAPAAGVERPGAAGHRLLDVHRDVRTGAVPGAGLALVRRRRLGARDHPHAADRQGRGRHRHQPARPGPRDGVEPDRRRPARACRSRTSRCCTATPQVAARGLDTYGSRSLVVGGIAVVKAAEKVVQKAKTVAAHLLEASEDDLEFTNGRFSVRGTPGTGMGIQDIALAAFTSHDWPEGVEPSIDADATFDPHNFSFPHGTHICAMEVDTETGMVKIRKYACVDDVGNVVNPLIVEGQVHGGLAQGIAQALYEEAVYDADGNLTTGTFVDYLVPSAADLPHFDTDSTVSPAHDNPLGVKGVGEAGTIASTPAVVNACPRRHPPPRRPRRPDAAARRSASGGRCRARGTAGTAAPDPTTRPGRDVR